MNEEQLRQLEESIRTLTDVTISRGQTDQAQLELMKRMAAAQGVNVKNLTQLNDDAGKLSSKVKEQTQIQEANNKAVKEHATAMANWAKAGENLAKSLTSFGSSLMSTTEGMKKYGQSASSLGDAALNVGKNFGVVGIAIGGLVKAISMATNAVFEQNDKILKSADSLSKFGATGDLTAQQIRRMGASAGYSIDNLEKFVKVTKSLGPDAMALGMTVTEGTKVFGELTKMNEQELAHYRSLGITQEEYNQSQADYIKLQIASGVAIRQENIQSGELRKNQKAYLDNLIELSAISGQDIDTLKQKQMLAMADQAYATRKAMMEEKEQSLRSRGLTEQADRIKAESAAKDSILNMAMASGMSGDQLKGLTHTLASGSYNELSASFLRAGVNIRQFEKDIADGKKGPRDFMYAMSDAVKRTRSQLGTAITLDKTIADTFGSTKEMMELETRLRGKNKDEQEKIIKEEIEKRKKGVDDITKDTRNAQETAERRLQIVRDQFIDTISGPVTNGFKQLMKALSWAAKGIAKFAGWALKDDSIAHAFDTPEDLKDSLADVTKNVDVLQSQLAKENEMRKQYLDTTEALNKKTKEVQDAKLAYDEMRKKGIGGQEAIDAANKIKQLTAEQMALQSKKNNLLAASGSVNAEGKTARQLSIEEKLAKLEQDRVSTLSRLAKKEQEMGTNIGTTTTNAESGAPAYTGAGGGRGGNYGAIATAGEGVDVAKGGVDLTSYLKKIALAESGGRAGVSAGTSSASGLFQFTEGTWSQMVKQMGKSYSLQDRFDPKKSAEVAAYFTRQQQQQIEKGTNRSASEADLYIGHFLGAGGAVKFLNALSANPNAPASQGADAKQIEANASIFYDKSGNMRSLRQVYDIMANKVDKAGTQLASGKGVSDDVKNINIQQGRSGGMFSGPDSGYPVLLHGNEVVIPLPNAGSVLAGDAVQKTALDAGTKDAMQSQFTSSPQASNSDMMADMMNTMMSMMAEKMDTMISKLNDSNDIQDKIYKVSAV